MKPFIKAGVLSFLVALCILLLWWTAYFSQLDLIAYDFTLRMAGPISPESPTVIVAIDEDSLGRVGAWPWSRDKVAKLIDRIENSNEQQEVLYDDLYFLYRKDGYALVGSTYKSNPDGTSSFGVYISSTCKEVGELVAFLKKAWQPELASGLDQDVYYRTAFELVENHASSNM